MSPKMLLNQLYRYKYNNLCQALHKIIAITVHLNKHAKQMYYWQRHINGKTENYKQLPPYIDSSKLLNLIIIHFNKLEQWNIPYIYRCSSSIYRFGYQIY